MSRHLIRPSDRRRHEQRERDGLLALAEEAPTLTSRQLEQRMSQLDRAGHLDEFLALADELTREGELVQSDLAEDDPRQSAAARDQALLWRRLRRRIGRRTDRVRVSASRPTRREPRSPARAGETSSGGPAGGDDGGGGEPPGPGSGTRKCELAVSSATLSRRWGGL